ncbi:CLUMA_CG015740, isoform A, partial [Clunio marinus]
RHNNNKKKKEYNEDKNILITKENDIVTLPEYEIRHSDVFGRYLVAARDLSTSEIIIQQLPLVVGPIANDENAPICLSCNQALEIDNSFRCFGCKFPLCSAHCTNRIHTKFECQYLKTHNIFQYLHLNEHRSELENDYEAITVLRCLMLKISSEQSWKQLNEMESHNEIRKNMPALWNRNQKVIVDRIRKKWKLEEFSEDEIHTICGILEVNCFEVGGNKGTSARALFPEAYLMCHDCVPNTNHTDDPITHELTVRTTKTIKKGEVISLSYAYTLQGTLKRRQHLNEAKFFWCICERCKSSDELSTHASTLLCPKCTYGFILSSNPLDENAEWRCSKCSFSLAAQFVMNLVTKLFDELDAIGGNNVIEIEGFMRKYSRTLHNNHYIFLSAKHSLCQLLGKVEGYLINELNAELLKRKEDLCRDLLEVIDVLEPGSSRLRGVILYELHAPVMLQLTRELQMGRIKNSDFKRRLKEVVQILNESYKILQYEPENSSENQMAVAAKSALDSMVEK